MYEPIVQKQIEEYEGWIDKVKKINGHATMVRRLEVEFPDWFYHASANMDMSVAFKFGDKDDLLRVLRHLRGYDYKVDSFDDYPAQAMRTYKINRLGHAKEPYASPDIRLHAYFDQGDDATCKYVEVGTKTVEEPVYEIQCD